MHLGLYYYGGANLRLVVTFTNNLNTGENEDAVKRIQ